MLEPRSKRLKAKHEAAASSGMASSGARGDIVEGNTTRGEHDSTEGNTDVTNDHNGEDHAADEMHEDDHAEGEDHADEDADHLAELEGLRLLHAWTNATDGDTAQVYVTIENMGDAEVYLTGAATGIAEAARLVHSNATHGPWHAVGQADVKVEVREPVYKAYHVVCRRGICHQAFHFLKCFLLRCLVVDCG